MTVPSNKCATEAFIYSSFFLVSPPFYTLYILYDLSKVGIEREQEREAGLSGINNLGFPSPLKGEGIK